MSDVLSRLKSRHLIVDEATLTGALGDGSRCDGLVVDGSDYVAVETSVQTLSRKVARGRLDAIEGMAERYQEEADQAIATIGKLPMLSEVLGLPIATSATHLVVTESTIRARGSCRCSRSDGQTGRRSSCARSPTSSVWSNSASSDGRCLLPSEAGSRRPSGRHSICTSPRWPGSSGRRRVPTPMQNSGSSCSRYVADQPRERLASRVTLALNPRQRLAIA